MSLRITGTILAGLSFIAMTSPASAFSASFKWCSGSPAITLSGVPKGTAKLAIRMIDLNAPSYNHGGGTVAFTGQKTVPCGAFSSNYAPPSPPASQVHTYEIEVKAVGANGEALGEASGTRKFPE